MIPEHVMKGNEEAEQYFNDQELADLDGLTASATTTEAAAPTDKAPSDTTTQEPSDPMLDEFDSDFLMDDQNAGRNNENWQQRALQAESQLQAQQSELATLKQQVSQLQAQMQSGISQSVDAELAKREAKAQKQAALEAKRAQARQRLNEYLDDDGMSAMDAYLETYTDTTAHEPEQATSVPQPTEQATPQATNSPDDVVRGNYAQQVLSVFPDYPNLVKTPAFSAWVQQQHSDGNTFYQHVLHANTTMNAAKMVALLNLYQQSQQEQTQQQQQLQRQVAPRRSRAGSTGANQTQGKYLTPQQIGMYYEKFARGEFTGRDQQWMKIEKLIKASEQHHGI